MHKCSQKFCFFWVLFIYSWLRETIGQLVERNYETSSKVWSGKQMVAFLHDMGITNATFPILQVGMCNNSYLFSLVCGC